MCTDRTDFENVYGHFIESKIRWNDLSMFVLHSEMLWPVAKLAESED